HEPAGVRRMLAVLAAWHAGGAHRVLASPTSTQYRDAAAVAIMDQLTPTVIRAIFGPLFAAGGRTAGGYKVLPMGFVNEPFNGGSADVPAWTADANTVAAGLTMPAYDAIGFTTIGVVGQPSIPWQNRPTFQQVISFPAHRPRPGTHR